MPEALIPFRTVVPKEEVFIYHEAADWFTRITGRENVRVDDVLVPQIDSNKQPVKDGFVAMVITNLNRNRNLVEYFDAVAEARKTRNKLIEDGLDPRNREDDNDIKFMVGISIRDSLARLRTPEILGRLSTRK